VLVKLTRARDVQIKKVERSAWQDTGRPWWIEPVTLWVQVVVEGVDVTAYDYGVP
jgi:hypothetical protein